EMGMGAINRGYEYDNAVAEVQPRSPNGAVTSQVVEGLPAKDSMGQAHRILLSCVAMSVGLGNSGGVGYGSAFGTACVLSYYCALMALTVYYFIQSFNAVLPWSVCNPEWISHNVTCIDDNTAISPNNRSIPELYFKIDVLREKDSIEDGLGLPDWRLSLCLLFSWAVILVSLIKGVKSAGKVAYFTALFPYVVLIILLIRGVTLEGAWDGIVYFINPQWEKMLEAKVWQAAISQCFFSLSVGFGPIIMFASYNPHSHNVYRDAMIISLTDTFTSLLAGFTIFAILGNLAHTTGVEIKDVVGAGPALAFASYPLAISKFEFLPQLFSVLFFLMLFTLGVGSATSLAGGLITVIHDQFPKSSKKLITTVVCFIGFLLGLVYVTPGGQWMIEIVDYFGASFVIYVMATIEIIGIVWVYGLNNVCRDIEFMLEKDVKKIGIYWKFCWGLFIPIILIAVLIRSLIGIKDGITYNGQEFPVALLVFGWALTLFAILLIPICAIHTILTRKKDTFMEKLKQSFEPTDDWGPVDPAIRKKWDDISQGNCERHFFVGWIQSVKQLMRKSNC
ncbi:Sodium-dependent nutrient amino acid transporter 1, partial [Orchesella cincta]